MTNTIIKKGFDMKKVFKVILEVLALLVGADCDTRRKAVDDGLCDFSGQGRGKYGK